MGRLTVLATRAFNYYAVTHLAAAILGVAPAVADVRLPKLVSDHIVLMTPRSPYAEKTQAACQGDYHP